MMMRLEPAIAFTTRFAIFRGYSVTEWWLRVGRHKRLMLAVRDHRETRALFSERYRRHPHAWYPHIGPYCFHVKWDGRPACNRTADEGN